MSFRYRPRSLLLRRTSSCSSLQLSGLMATAAGGVGIGGRHHKLPSKDWACNDGAPPSGHFLQVPGEEEEDEENEKENKEKNNNNKNKARPPPPPIILEPSREGTVEHISVIEDPDPQCHFCCEQTSRPVHENCTRLKIVSRGLVRSRDGSHLSPNTQPYISLPSPNIQSAKPTVPCMATPGGGSGVDQDGGDHSDGLSPGPVGPGDMSGVSSGKDGLLNPESASQHLVRRGALVPPKMTGEMDDDDLLSPSPSPSPSPSADSCKSAQFRQRTSLSTTNGCPGATTLSVPTSTPAASNAQPNATPSPSSSTTSAPPGHRVSAPPALEPKQMSSEWGEGGPSASQSQKASVASSEVSAANAVSTGSSGSRSGSSDSAGRIFPRRSSIVVIPPMQVCPGDLLVYSKALTHRGNFADIDGSTQSLANDSESHSTVSSNRKSKTTWSMLKWFDRDKKTTKGESPNGLEEVLTTISTSDFSDEQLTRLCGLNYVDFVELVDMDRRGVVFWLSSSIRRHHSHAGRETAAATATAAAAAAAASSRASSVPSAAAMNNHVSERMPGKLPTSLTEEDENAEDEDAVTDLVRPSIPEKLVANKENVSSATPTTAQKRATRLKRTQSERGMDVASVANAEARMRHQNASAEGGKKKPPPISPRKHEIEGKSPPPPLNRAPLPPPKLQPQQQQRPTSAKTQQSSSDIPDSFTEEVQRRIRAKRANLVHSMTFTAKDLDPTARFMTGKEKIHTQESKRREALWDLFQSELYFLIDYLMVLKHVFMEPLKKVQVEGHIMMAEPEMLFGNLDELCCVTYSFCKDFLHWLLVSITPDGELPVTEVISRLFEKEGKTKSLSQAYHRYSLNYINALTYLESLRKHQEFCDFEKWCYRDPRCKKLQLTDFLVAPVHHIMKIPLIIKHIEERTESPEEKAVITKVLDMKEASLRELDDKMKWLKNFERLLEIQRNIVWPSVLDLDTKQYVPDFLKTALSRQPCERLIVSPRRQILLEGPLMLLDSGKAQEMYLILFDDLFIITRKKKALSKKKSTLSENWPNRGSHSSSSSYHSHHGGLDNSAMKYVVHKQPLSLDRFFIHEVSAQESASAKLENAFVLICLNRFQQIVQVHTFQAETEIVKREWLAKLREAQEIWRRTLQTTIFKGTVQFNAAAAGGRSSTQSSPTVGD